MTKFSNKKKKGSSVERRVGIRDWIQKREALEILFAANSNEGLAEKVLGPSGDDALIRAIAGSLKSWATHRPTGSTGTMFVRAVADRLAEIGVEATKDTIQGVFCNRSYQDFVYMLPLSRRKGLPESREFEDATTLKSLARTHDLVYLLREPIESFKYPLQRGRIDQKFHYLTPHAATYWKDVVNSGAYHQYDECRNALNKFCNSEHWNSFFSDKENANCVMLGCGAWSKDYLLIDNMIRHVNAETIINYSMVDFSTFMLKASLHQVNAAMDNHGISHRVQLHPVEQDFLDLQDRVSILRKPDIPAIWLITGGTIGNINEKRFFDSLSRVMMSGDWLVVGAETFTQPVTVELKRELLKKYDTPEIRRFVESPLYTIWLESRRDAAELSRVLKAIKVEVVDAVEHEHSSVRGSISVEVSVPIDGRKVILLSSNRYLEQELVEFAVYRGFNNIASIESPFNVKYKLFVFAYLGGKSETP